MLWSPARGGQWLTLAQAYLPSHEDPPSAALEAALWRDGFPLAHAPPSVAALLHSHCQAARSMTPSGVRSFLREGARHAALAGAPEDVRQARAVPAACSAACSMLHAGIEPSHDATELSLQYAACAACGEHTAAAALQRMHQLSVAEHAFNTARC